MLWALVALALQSQPLTENDWLVVATGADRSEWMYRLRDITDDGTITHAWLKVELPIQQGRIERYSMRRYRFDCARRAYRLDSAVRYRANGAVIDTYDALEYLDNFHEVTPDSIIESVLTSACSYARILRQQPPAGK